MAGVMQPPEPNSRGHEGHLDCCRAPGTSLNTFGTDRRSQRHPEAAFFAPEGWGGALCLQALSLLGLLAKIKV